MKGEEVEEDGVEETASEDKAVEAVEEEEVIGLIRKKIKIVRLSVNLLLRILHSIINPEGMIEEIKEEVVEAAKTLTMETVNGLRSKRKVLAKPSGSTTRIRKQLINNSARIDPKLHSLPNRLKMSEKITI